MYDFCLCLAYLPIPMFAVRGEKNQIFSYFSDQVFDMCNNCSKTINTDWGIIRSHPNYPWFFNSDVKYSKRIIEVRDAMYRGLCLEFKT